MKNCYYVYQLTYDNRVLYIGSGKGSRIAHVLSCKSHNSCLNRFSALGWVDDKLELVKISENLSQAESLVVEKDKICSLQPLFNTVHNTAYYRAEEVEYYLEQHQAQRMFDVLGWGKSEPYIENFKSQIKQLQECLDMVWEDNARLRALLKKV